MHEVLAVLTVVTDPQGRSWVLAMPTGGGAVQALSPAAAQRGHEQGWLDGYRPDAGLEQARQTQPEPLAITPYELTEFVYKTVGAASVPFMRDNPDYVMPAEEVGQVVREQLREAFGFDAAEFEGYWGLKG